MTTLQVADSTISLGGLITGSDYEWQVQTNCGINTSEWVIGEIFTAGATPCPAPADLTVGTLRSIVQTSVGLRRMARRIMKSGIV